MDMRNKNSRFLTEDIALKFETLLFNFWDKGIDKRWFWLSFQALEKFGLTYFESSEEEMMVRERLVLLGVIYYEYCFRSGLHESEHFNYWDEPLITSINLDFSEDVSDNILDVKRALTSYFKTEEGVTNELWINCYEGSHNKILKTSDIFKALEDKSYERNEGENWFKGIIDDLQDYEGISL
jgi:hypothetical protein